MFTAYPHMPHQRVTGVPIKQLTLNDAVAWRAFFMNIFAVCRMNYRKLNLSEAKSVGKLLVPLLEHPSDFVFTASVKEHEILKNPCCINWFLHLARSACRICNGLGVRFRASPHSVSQRLFSTASYISYWTVQWITCALATRSSVWLTNQR